MNPYASVLQAAPDEVAKFRQSDDGNGFEDPWFDQILDLIEKARLAKTAPDAERYLDMLLWSIVDSGPLTTGLSDSVEQAARTMQPLRNRRFIASRDDQRKRG